MFRIIILVIATVSTLDSAEARHRRRHHARPEVHHSVRLSAGNSGTTRECPQLTWAEGTAVPFAYASGTSILDAFSGRDTKW